MSVLSSGVINIKQTGNFDKKTEDEGLRPRDDVYCDLSDEPDMSLCLQRVSWPLETQEERHSL